MEYVEAGDASIPKLGLGTWQTTGRPCRETVRKALEAGYRHVDTAQIYDNESEVGSGLAAADVDREDVFLTTKVWRSNLRQTDLTATVKESLENLGVDYVDLLLIHWPHPRVPVAEPLSEMTRLREQGLVRHLGVSNFTRAQLETARTAVDAPLVTDQVLYNPYKDQSSLLGYCQREGIALTAYSPLARGDALDDQVLGTIGDRYDKSTAQVTLRWLVQQAGVVAIPKTTSESHLQQNLDVFDFELSDDEMSRIDARTGGIRARIRNRLPSLMRRLPV